MTQPGAHPFRVRSEAAKLLTNPRRTTARRWMRTLVPPLCIYLSLSLLTGIILRLTSRSQTALAENVVNPSSPDAWYHLEIPTEAAPGYFGVLANWDGQWYATIALHGYPGSLPMENGSVIQNPWAFWPTYPALVRVVMEASGLSFGQAAWLVSVSSAALASIVFYRLFQNALGSFGAYAVLIVLFANPVAAILQAAYAESLTLLLLALMLSNLNGRKYYRCFPLAAVLAFTRPVMLPFAMVVLSHYMYRIAAERRHNEPFSTRERRTVVVLAAWCGLLAFGWYAVSAGVTGRIDSALATLAAWRNYGGSAGVLGGWGDTVIGGGVLGIAVTGIVAGQLWLLMRRSARLWPFEARIWAGSYLLYILAITRPSASILRYAMLTITTLWPFPEVTPSLQQRRAPWIILGCVVFAGIISQVFWISNVWIIHSLTNQAGPP